MHNIFQRYRVLTKGDKYLAWLFGALVLFSYLPILSLRVGAYLFLLLVGVCYLVALFYSRSMFGRIISPLFLIMLFLLLLYITSPSLQFMGTRQIFIWLYDQSIFFLPLFIASFLFFTRRYQLLALVTQLALGVLVITAVTTYIGLNIFPEASRILATGDTGEDFAYYKYNIGGYGFVYSLVIVTPAYIYLIRQHLVNRWVGLICLAFLSLTIIKTQYAFAFLLLAFNLILFILPFRLVRPRTLITCAVVMIIILLCFTPWLPQSLNALASFVKFPILSNKISGMADYLQYGNTDSAEGVTVRQIKYEESILTFIDSPIIGNLGREYRRLPGGHSTFIDTLAITGLLGGILFFKILQYYYRRILKPFHLFPTFGYVYWSFLLYIILSFINTTNSVGMAVFLIIPGIAFLDQRKAQA